MNGRTSSLAHLRLRLVLISSISTAFDSVTAVVVGSIIAARGNGEEASDGSILYYIGLDVVLIFRQEFLPVAGSGEGDLPRRVRLVSDE